MKMIMSTLAALAFLVAPARAADIYHPGGLKDGPAASSAASGGITWTGVYIGVQGGYGNADHKLSVEAYNAEESAVLGSLDGLNSRGFIGGGRIGYDFQLGRFVAGPFADYNFSNIDSELKIGSQSATVEKGDEWTLGGRAGLLVTPATLIYGLVGYTQTNYALHASGAGKLGDQDFKGLTGGAGIETALTKNLFIGLEYQHTWYDGETIADSATGCADCTSGVRLKDDLSEDRIMGRVSLKLSGGLLGQ
jgi:outer membrane immunogenic protein